MAPASEVIVSFDGLFCSVARSFSFYFHSFIFNRAIETVLLRELLNPIDRAGDADRLRDLLDFDMRNLEAQARNIVQRWRVDIAPFRHPPEPPQEAPPDPGHFRELRLQSLRRHERDLQQHQHRQESQRQRRLERRVQRQPRQLPHRHHQMRSHR